MAYVEQTPEQIETLRILLELSEGLIPGAISADDWFLRGNAYYLTGQPGNALVCYGCALNIQPIFPEVMAALRVLGKEEHA